MKAHERRQPWVSRLTGERKHVRGPAEAAPALGGLYVSPLTSELGIEWALLRLGPGGESVFAVPADMDSRCGSSDVALPAEASAGPLTLRCGLGLWLPAGAFDPARKSGQLEEGHLGRARERLEAVEGGRLRSGYSERKVDELPAYRRWIREGPLAARDRMAQSAAAGAVSAGPTSRLHLAAFLLLSVGIGLLAAVLWNAGFQSDPGEDSAMRGGRPRPSLTPEIVEPPVTELSDISSQVRGPEPEAPATELKTVRGKGGLYVLALYDFELVGKKSYRLTIESREREETRLVLDGELPRTAAVTGSLTLILRAEHYPPGRYRLLLTESEGDPPASILDFELELVQESDEEKEEIS